MVDLSQYGITDVKEIIYNPTYEQLFEEEMNPELTGFDKGQLTELDAVNVMTGIFTGRSPKDKYIVMDENSKDTVWWTTEGYKNDNHPLSEENWAKLKALAKKIVNVIVWNFWQMDGLTGIVPYGEPEKEYEQVDMFSMMDMMMQPEPAVKTSDAVKQNTECRIFDWRANDSVKFSSIRKG